MNNCCEKLRKTVSVSTRKGRRAICNSCGAPWEADSVSSALSSNAETTQTTPTTPTTPSEWAIKFDEWWSRHDTIMGGLSSNLTPELKKFFLEALHHNTEDIIDRAIAKIPDEPATCGCRLQCQFHARITKRLKADLAALKPTHKE